MPRDVAAARRLALVLTSSDWMAEEIAVRAVRRAEHSRDTGPVCPFRVRVLLCVPGEVAEVRHALGLAADDGQDTSMPTAGLLDRWSEMYFRLPVTDQAVLWHRYVEGEDEATAALSAGITADAVTPRVAQAEAALCALFMAQAAASAGSRDCRLSSTATPAEDHLARCARCAAVAEARSTLTTVVMRRAVAAVVGNRVATFYCPALFGNELAVRPAPGGRAWQAPPPLPGRGPVSRSRHVGGQATAAVVATVLAGVTLAGAASLVWRDGTAPAGPVAAPTAVTTTSPRLSPTAGVLQPGNLDVLSTTPTAPPPATTVAAPVRAEGVLALEPVTIDGPLTAGGTVGLHLALANVGHGPLRDLVVQVELRDASPAGRPRVPDDWLCGAVANGYRCEAVEVAAGALVVLELPLRADDSVETVVVIGRVWSEGRLATTSYSTFTTVRRPTTPRPTPSSTAPATTATSAAPSTSPRSTVVTSTSPG
nr:hypothetical protein GCM10017745_49610 [Saccharothrix mutabilis subsp. capreolus]